MDVEKLKQKILDLAIRGKLVPQDPNDEPASVLIEKIRTEKEKLVKDGNIKPSKDESYIYKGTDNCYYENVKLNDIAEIIMGQSPEGDTIIENTEKGIEFHQGKIFFTDTYISRSNKNTINPKKKAPKHSILMCVRAPVGNVNITDREIAIGRGLCAIKPYSNVNLKYLYYCLLLEKKELEKHSTGSTFNSITVDVIKKINICLPNYNTQVKVSKFVDQIFEKIDSIKYEKESLEFLIQLTKGKILEFYFGDNSTYKSYYQNYSTTIGESIEFERGSSPRPIKSFLTNDGVNWIKISDGKSDNMFIDSSSEKITLAGAKKSRAVFAGDLILSNSMSYGKPYILKIDGFIHDGWFVFRNNNSITIKYLYYFLSSNYAQNQIKSFARGSTVSNISSDLMKKISITIYEIPIQDKIVKEIEEKFKIIDIIKEQLI